MSIVTSPVMLASAPTVIFLACGLGSMRSPEQLILSCRMVGACRVAGLGGRQRGFGGYAEPRSRLRYDPGRSERRAVAGSPCEGSYRAALALHSVVSLC